VTRILTRVLHRRPALTLDDVYAQALALAIGDPAARLAELVAESDELVSEARTALMWTESQQEDIREAYRHGLTYETLMDRRGRAEEYAGSPEYAADVQERQLAEDEAALSIECDGCGAEPGEPCRPWCLSGVTDETGQPINDDEDQDDDGDDFDFWRDVIGDDIVCCGVVYSRDEYKLTSEGVEPLTDEEKAARRAAEDQAEAERYAALTPEQRAAEDAERESLRRLLDAPRRPLAPGEDEPPF
jgi:hypothetical protein